MRQRLIALLVACLVLSLPVVHAAELHLAYDQNDNLVSGDGKYRVYNSLNQLVAVYNGSDENGTLLEAYVYHPTEERIMVKDAYYPNGSVEESTIYFSKTFVRVENASGAFNFTYVYLDGQLVAQHNPDGTRLFVHGNHEGSSSVVTNESGAVVERTEYSPFGEQLNSSRMRFGYEGKEADSLVGDTDFNFRKYKSEWGMFTQPDTLIQNVYDPQSLNRYSFERNNPLNKLDPTGHTTAVVRYFPVENIFRWPYVGDLFKFGPGTVDLTIYVPAGPSEGVGAPLQTYRGLTGKDYENKEDWWDAELPKQGEAFENTRPRDRPGQRYKRDNEGNPIDRQGRSWKPDHNEGGHWDRQDPGGGHTRISPDGQILGSTIIIPSEMTRTSYNSPSTIRVGSTYVNRGTTLTVARAGVTNGVGWTVSKPHAPTYKWKL